MDWKDVSSIPKTTFCCGFCGNQVGSDRGYVGVTMGSNMRHYVVICPGCDLPSFFRESKQISPRPKPGRNIRDISDKAVKCLYEEARNCLQAGAYTAAVLVCRKILMNLGHSYGVKEGKSFVAYVNYLESNHYTPPNGKAWVDKIRQKGNEATHEIPQITYEDAIAILALVEMLLTFNFEGPAIAKELEK